MKHTTLTLLAALALWGLGAAAASPITKQFMTSASVDFAKDTATLPLHLGHMQDGRNVYYVITDTTDAVEAQRLGVVHAVQLAAAGAAKSTRTATLAKDGSFIFQAGTVDFSPKQSLVPGEAPNFFPPKAFAPGSIGDAAYSPFVKLAGTNTIYNAPIVAFDVLPSQIDFCNGHVNYDLVHDRVAAICPRTMKVSIKLGHGYASGSKVVYLSFDANNPLPATMEQSTYTPATADLVGSGASETLFGFANGATGAANPDRQGFNSALSGEGPPLNILDGLSPLSSGYTPLWDVNVAVYTDAAIAMGKRHLVTSGTQADQLSQLGYITNPMGKMVGSLGLLVNCPVIGFVK